jgi:predicted NAD/FAD-dependent oxidoreductase
MRHILHCICLFFIAPGPVSFCGIPAGHQDQVQYDLVIYGGTSAGIAAAIQASRMGKTALVIEPGSRIGGLTTGGLGQTDIGNKQAIGGIAREFYRNVRTYYQNPDNWKWQKPEEYRDGGQTRTETGEDAMWTFEPSVALKILQDMVVAEARITLVYNQRLDRKNGVSWSMGASSPSPWKAERCTPAECLSMLRTKAT